MSHEEEDPERGMIHEEEDLERGSDELDITFVDDLQDRGENWTPKFSTSLPDTSSDLEQSTEYPQAQFALTCSMCDSPSDLFCDGCEVRICKLCVTNHLKIKSQRKHNVVAYNDRSVGKTFCCEHPSTEGTYRCRKCAVLICDECAKKSHKLHNRDFLPELLERQTNLLMRNTTELKSVIKPVYQRKIEHLKRNLANAEKSYSAIDSDISLCGSKLHQEVDFAVESLRSEVRTFKEEHLADLAHEISQLEIRLKEVEDTVEKSDGILLSPDQLLEYGPDITPLKTMPEMTNFEMPVFTPGQVEIKSEIGQLSRLVKSVSPAAVIKKTSKKQSKQMKRHPTIEVSVPVGQRYVYDIACASESAVWMCGAGIFYNDNNLRLIELDGKNSETLECQVNPKYIALKSHGCLLFSDHSDNTVKLWSQEVQKVFVRLEDWTPKGLAVTLSGDVIVCQSKEAEAAVTFTTLSRVVKYDDKGWEVRNMEFDGSKRLFRNALYVAENRNFDICVSDESKHSVVVLDKLGKLQFVYKGNVKTGRYRNFNPRGITTDSQCNILISDYMNYTIHIIDQHGQFLSYLLPKKVSFPLGLSVDESDKIWVGEYSNGTISVIEYLW